ncbi:MAG: hypothetical protein ACE1Z6_01210 [Candidatus Methylomirabilales bacterium]|nr:hypothetical protein [candidate division NC10 bacterium]
MKQSLRSVMWALAAAAFWLVSVAGAGTAYARGGHRGGHGGHAGHFGGHARHFGGHARHVGRHHGHRGHIGDGHHFGHRRHIGHLHGFAGRSWWGDDPLPSPASRSPVPFYFHPTAESYYCYDPSGFYYPCAPFRVK